MELLNKTIIDLIYKYLNYNYSKIFFIFLKCIIKKIIFNTYLEIFYPRKFILNYEFLNYINIFESLLGFKPFLKKINIFFFNYTIKKKKLIFTKKKKFSFLKFKFYIFFHLNKEIFFIFLKNIYIYMEIYKKIFEYFNLIEFYPSFHVYKLKNNIQIFKFLNMFLLLKLFFLYKNDFLFIIQNDKIFINILFYKIKQNLLL